jgi:hypothetical protein
MRFLYRGPPAALDFIWWQMPHQHRAETHKARPGWMSDRPPLPGPRGLASWNSNKQEHAMMDVIVLGLGIVFFVVTIAYAYACDRL